MGEIRGLLKLNFLIYFYIGQTQNIKATDQKRGGNATVAERNYSMFSVISFEPAKLSRML